ncbi:MAG: hypothetical protein QE570_06390 [Verrucomicrobiota bacterium]|nr:hypothetical protein [Verrucomicrobiota bacterium]
MKHMLSLLVILITCFSEVQAEATTLRTGLGGHRAEACHQARGHAE